MKANLTPSHTSYRTRRGLALVMTVIILALVTIMVLGFADLVRNETASSGAHVERAKSQTLAEMGVDMVIGTLREHTADPAKVWATQPGALLVPAEGATETQVTILSRQIPLHSGLPSTPPSSGDELGTPDPLAPANLNIQTLNDPNSHVITDQRVDPNDPASPPVSLPLRWLYLRENGELETTETPVLTNADNPLVGRVAWWADDESSKININTAWKRNPRTGGSLIKNPFNPSHVSSVNLSSLFLSSAGMSKEQAYNLADRIHAKVAPEPYDYSVVKRFFNSTRELRELGDDFVPVFNATKFELTHYNHDPDTTFFNEPRIVLTTQQKLANGRPFLDILTTANSDPGLVSSLSFSKLNTTVLKLIEYLERKDWPMATPGRSLQVKYYGETRPDRLAQLAVNIIDYVRSAESTRNITEPLRGILEGQDKDRKFTSTMEKGDLAGQNLTYKGISRSLYITEMGGWINKTAEPNGPNAGRYKVRLFVEIHLPPNFGIDEINFGGNDEMGTGMDGRNLYVFTPFTGVDGFYDSSGKLLKGKLHRVYQDNIVGADPRLKQGEYRTAFFEGYQAIAPGAQPPTSTTLRYALIFKTDKTPTAADGGWRCEVTPVSTGCPYTYPVDVANAAPETQLPLIPSLESADPLMNVVKADYAKPSGTVNTFNARNKRATDVVGKVAYTINPNLGAPEQDTDADNKITDASLRMPFPKGHAKNPDGVVYSPGELGYIHTGVEMDATKTSGGVGWRTLRLQPYRNYTRKAAAQIEVPDWAFMDLFTVPTSVNERTKAMFGPHGGTAGRINLNAQAQPFGNPDLVATPLERRQAFVALLTDVYKKEPSMALPEGEYLTQAEANFVATNIYFRTLDTTGTTKGRKYGYEAAYDSPGEVVEIKGVADRGEESEAVVRGIANLISTRGGVFTVNSIGQSLQQTRNGQLVVTGETRQQTMIERYTDSSAPGEVKFRRLRYEPITP